jgi:hypothetical protein
LSPEPSPTIPAPWGLNPSGFMADARHAPQPASCLPCQSQQPAVSDNGWQVISRCKKWRRVAHHPAPSRRPVLADLIGRCFNCLRQDQVAAMCTFTPRCLRCHGEGHQARACKHPRSPEAGGLPPCLSWPPVLVLQPEQGELTLAEPREVRRCGSAALRPETLATSSSSSP